MEPSTKRRKAASSADLPRLKPAKAKSGKQAKAKAAQTPSARGMAIQREAQKQKLDCGDLRRQCSKNKGQEGLVSMLEVHEKEWQIIFAQCSEKLDADNVNDDISNWQDTSEQSDKLHSNTKDTLDVVRATISALTRQKSKRASAAQNRA